MMWFFAAGFALGGLILDRGEPSVALEVLDLGLKVHLGFLQFDDGGGKSLQVVLEGAEPFC